MEPPTNTPVPVQEPLPEDEELTTEQILDHHKEHWKAVGKHMKESRKPWDGSRLQALMPH